MLPPTPHLLHPSLLETNPPVAPFLRRYLYALFLRYRLPRLVNDVLPFTFFCSATAPSNGKRSPNVSPSLAQYAIVGTVRHRILQKIPDSLPRFRFARKELPLRGTRGGEGSITSWLQLRLATQEPTISPRLLDLCSFTLVYRFTSPDWLKVLKTHLVAALLHILTETNSDVLG